MHKIAIVYISCVAPTAEVAVNNQDIKILILLAAFNFKDYALGN